MVATLTLASTKVPTTQSVYQIFSYNLTWIRQKSSKHSLNVTFCNIALDCAVMCSCKGYAHTAGSIAQFPCFAQILLFVLSFILSVKCDLHQTLVLNIHNSKATYMSSKQMWCHTQHGVFKETSMDATYVSMCTCDIVQSEVIKLLSDMLVWFSVYISCCILMHPFLQWEWHTEGKN